MTKYLIPILWFASISYSIAQVKPVEENEVDEIIDNILMEEESIDDFLYSATNFQFLYLSLNYASDTYFSGRDIDVDQYNLRPQISYMHSKGFYGSLSGIYYSEFSPHWDVTTATAGYGNSIGKKKLLRYYASYSQYFYSNDIEDLYNGTFNAGIGIHNKKRSLGTTLSGTYYLGGEHTYQIVSRTYASFNLLKNPKHKIKFRPQISFITGTQLVDVSQVSALKEETFNENTETSDYTLIYSQINFPLLYSSKSFDIEFGYNLNFPSEIGMDTNLENTSFFNISLGYIIDL
ncbi:MAG: hypothetical protein ABFR05_06305 [Bacteroidota bacterium]